MPHDVFGNEVKVGDLVTIAARITQLNTGEDYCNVTIETIVGRRPDGKPEVISAINTGVLTLTGENGRPAPDQVSRPGFTV